MKKIVEEPVLKSLDAVVTGVIEVRPSEGLLPRSPGSALSWTAEQWPVCLLQRCETGSDGLTVGWS